jgi:hypothetical protein
MRRLTGDEMGSAMLLLPSHTCSENRVKSNGGRVFQVVATRCRNMAPMLPMGEADELPAQVSRWARCRPVVGTCRALGTGRGSSKRSRKVQRNTHEGEEVELRCAATSGAVSCLVISCRIRPASRAVE